MGNLCGKKSKSKRQANAAAPIRRADTTVITSRNLSRTAVNNPTFPKVVHALKFVRTRSQLEPSRTINGQQFDLSIITEITGDSKIYHYLKVINRMGFCEVAKMFYSINGAPKSFVYKVSIGKLECLANSSLFQFI
jgi:hypothetical protein